MDNLRNIKTMGQLGAKIRSDPELEKRMKDNPAEVIEEIASGHVPNTTVYKIVVSALGGAILVSLVGAIMIVLNLGDMNNIPDILIATASASVGALAGLLAPQPGNN